MIQRIQTIYLLISIICLSIVSFNTVFFTGIIENGKVILTGNSMDTIMSNNDEDKYSNIHLYIVFIAIGLISILTIFSYKNLKKQLQFARVNAFLYLLASIILTILVYFLAKGSKSIEIGLGFYILQIGLITSMLATRSIKKDKSLIESVDRLR